MMGHADVRTTTRYAHLVDPRRRENARRLAVAIPAEVLPTREEIQGTAPTATPKNSFDAECGFADRAA